MPIILEPEDDQPATIQCTEQEIVRPDIPEIDGCPVLTQVKAFVVPQGASRVMEWVMRDGSGQPIDLSACLPDSASDSSASSLSSGIDGSAVVRIREVTGGGPCSPLYEAPAIGYGVSGGVLRAIVPTAVADTPGVYQVNWGILNAAGELTIQNSSYLFVERSLFGSNPSNLNGPPSLTEIRMSLRDFAPRNLLLDDVEFDAAEIVHAIVRPIGEWNDRPPDVIRYTTQNFPYRSQWLTAIHSKLFEAAAHAFRRNHLPYSAGGLQINDQGKEREYLEAALRAKESWQKFVIHRKVEINSRLAMGSLGGYSYF